MVAHLSAHVVLWTVGALACLTVIMYNPLVARLWPILTGARGPYLPGRPVSGNERRNDANLQHL